MYAHEQSGRSWRPPEADFVALQQISPRCCLCARLHDIRKLRADWHIAIDIERKQRRNAGCVCVTRYSTARVMPLRVHSPSLLLVYSCCSSSETRQRRWLQQARKSTGKLAIARASPLLRRLSSGWTGGPPQGSLSPCARVCVDQHWHEEPQQARLPPTPTSPTEGADRIQEVRCSRLGFYPGA